jgi:hypothetical protein
MWYATHDSLVVESQNHPALWMAGIGTCSLLQGDPTGGSSDVNRVLAQDGNSSVNLAS